MDISKVNSFFDMCISECCFLQGNIEEIINLLYGFGYRTVAINYLIENGNVEVKRKKKKGDPREFLDIVPIPYTTLQVKEVIARLNVDNFIILNRLTIAFSNQEILHKITKSPNFKKYDIVAALPTTMQAFMFTCSTLEADIFTIDPENKFNLRLTRKLYNQLVERGYHFELLYGPAIEDSTKRKNLIHASHLYHSFGKSKNIIFSSGAQTYLHIRSPYDIISLGFIFGLSQLQCKNALTHYPSNVIINSVGRKHGKSVMFVQNEEVKHSSVITLEDSEEENMDLDEPAQKKTKV